MGNPNRFLIIAGKGTVSTTRRIFMLVVSAKPPATEAQERIGLALIGEEGIRQVYKSENRAQGSEDFPNSLFNLKLALRQSLLLFHKSFKFWNFRRWGVISPVACISGARQGDKYY